MNTMFELPSRSDVKECLIGEYCITLGAKPKLVLYDEVVFELPALNF